MARYLSVFSFKQKEPAHLFIHYNRRLQVPSDGLDVGTVSIPVCPRVCVTSRVAAWCMAGSPPYARGLPVLDGHLSMSLGGWRRPRPQVFAPFLGRQPHAGLLGAGSRGMVVPLAMIVWPFRWMYSIPYGRFRS